MPFTAKIGYQYLQDDDIGQYFRESLVVVEYDYIVGYGRQFIFRIEPLRQHDEKGVFAILSGPLNDSTGKESANASRVKRPDTTVNEYVHKVRV